MIGNNGITAPWISGVFNVLTDYRKLDDLLVDAMVSPDSAFESMTEKPYADNDLADAVSRFDESITLIDNIDQITFLRDAGVKEVEKCIIEKLNIVGDRKGFILGTSDFLEENTPYENLIAMSETAAKYGG